MIAPFVLAAALAAPSPAFSTDFSGTWRCGNARYHERWEIRSRPGAPPGSDLTDVVYGDPSSPDGFAYVYYVPGARAWRYDDFHADGGQSHLRSDGPRNGVWTWTGWYYPANGPADDGPVITWERSGRSIDRHFSRRIDGRVVEQGSDRCSPA